MSLMDEECCGECTALWDPVCDGLWFGVCVWCVGGLSALMKIGTEEV